MALDPPLDLPADAVRAELAPLRNNFSVALYACQNAFAVGAIVRVAHSFLAREIILIGSDAYYEKASMGMEKYETVTRVADEKAFAAYVSGRPIWAFEREPATKSLYSSDPFPPGVVFVFGSERFGLPRELLAMADRVVAIPMYGVNNSFPVAIAAGIAMSEWARRRYAGALI